MLRSRLLAAALLVACSPTSDRTPVTVDAAVVEPEEVAPRVELAEDTVELPEARSTPPPGLLTVGPEVFCARGGTPGIFTESHEALGVTFEQDAKEEGPTGPHSGAIGGGAAIADFDGDGWLDIAFANIVGPDELYLTSGNGPLVWERRELARPQGAVHVGAYASDPDGDGDMDILFSPPGQGGGLAINDGTAQFVLDVSTIPKPPGQAIDFSMAWGDVNADGALDILVAGGPDAAFGSDGPGAPELLYLGQTGSLQFTPAPMPTYPAEGQAFIAAFVDIDNDSDQDIYVVNDFGLTVLANQLLVNDGTGHFEDRSDDAYAPMWGMGFGTGDFDNDGWMDLWAGSMKPLEDVLLHNQRDGTFADATYPMKAGSMEYGAGVSWGATFIDVDNDGDEDLFVTHGFHPVIAAGFGPGTAFTPNPELQPDVLLVNNGCLPRQTLGAPDQCENVSFWTKAAKAACATSGAVPISVVHPTSCGDKLYRDAQFTCCRGFVDGSKSSRLDGPASGRNPVEADLDGDGFPDLLVGNINDSPYIYLNGCSGAVSWLGVRLKPTRSNPGAIGARINVVADGVMHTREIGSGSDGLFGSPPPEVTVGLGTAGKVERLEVIWLGGETQRFEDLDVRRWVTVWQSPEPPG